MKLRIHSNSIRLRLAKDDVASLCQNGSVYSVCHFGDNHLTFGVRNTNGEDMIASFAGNRIIVDVPKSLLKGWEDDDRVGFEATDEEGLHILVQKDFQCLVPREGEDQENLYPNPQA